MVDVYWLNRDACDAMPVIPASKVEEYEAQRWLTMTPEKNGNVEYEAVTNFREYLRIPTVQPDVNYGM